MWVRSAKCVSTLSKHTPIPLPPPSGTHACCPTHPPCQAACQRVVTTISQDATNGRSVSEARVRYLVDVFCSAGGAAALALVLRRWYGAVDGAPSVQSLVVGVCPLVALVVDTVGAALRMPPPALPSPPPVPAHAHSQSWSPQRIGPGAGGAPSKGDDPLVGTHASTCHPCTRPALMAQ